VARLKAIAEMSSTVPLVSAFLGLAHCLVKSTVSDMF
jgi:hypothetical protein